MDRKWIEDSVDKYADTITRIGYTWFNNLYDAQDICQNVLIKLSTQSNQFSSAEAEKAWIIRITINECKNLKKSAWKRKIVSLVEANHLSAEFVIQDSEILQLVQKLPLKYRNVIYLRYYEGYSVSEIAELLHIKPALVSTHLARAKENLKKELGGKNYVHTV